MRCLEPVQCPGCNQRPACGTIAPPAAGRSLAMGKDVLDNPELVRKLLYELIEEKERKGEL